jgi:hypothetical protein
MFLISPLLLEKALNQRMEFCRSDPRVHKAHVRRFLSRGRRPNTFKATTPLGRKSNMQPLFAAAILLLYLLFGEPVRPCPKSVFWSATDKHLRPIFCWLRAAKVGVASSRELKKDPESLELKTCSKLLKLGFFRISKQLGDGGIQTKVSKQMAAPTRFFATLSSLVYRTFW